MRRPRPPSPPRPSTTKAKPPHKPQPQHRKPEPAPRPERTAQKEHKVAGKNAVRALFAVRRDDIRRVYITEANVRAFGDLLKWCAAQKIAYHIKETLDLDTVAETVHHDGICAIARAKPPSSTSELLAYVERTSGPLSLVLLEDIKNPHNLGAILRVCAHFGVRYALTLGDTAALSPAAMRTAEGGAEHTSLVPLESFGIRQTLVSLGMQIVATSSHAPARPLDRASLPGRALLLFGSEGEGLSQQLLRQADSVVAIPGSGLLESLNVACASSVLLWEHWRAHRAQSGVSSSGPSNTTTTGKVSTGARR